MSFSSFLASPMVSGISSLAGTAFGGLNSIMGIINTNKMINAQKQMNQQNIASQERINQQNIDFQKGINDIMRHDANNAISIKKQDMINAGYSTADPNMQGNAIAQLGSPQLQAPQVESEFNSDMANYQQNAIGSFAQSLIDNANTMADIQLKQAEATEKDAHASYLRKQTNWVDLKELMSYKQAVENILNAQTNREFTEVQKQEVLQGIENMKSQNDLLQEQIIMARIKNKFEPEKCQLAIQELRATINNLRATYNNILADTSRKKSETALNYEKINTEKTQQGLNQSMAENQDSQANLNKSKSIHERIEAGLNVMQGKMQYVKNLFAAAGVNFDGSGIVDQTKKAIFHYKTGFWVANPAGSAVLDYMENSLGEMDSLIYPIK